MIRALPVIAISFCPTLPPLRASAVASPFFILSQSGERPENLKRVSAAEWTALFEFRTVAANISELFGSLEKPPLAPLPFFLGG